MVDDFTGGPEDESSRPGHITDSIRKALVTGISALFLTEEGIRGAVSDLRLPKEALTFLAQQTDRTRREVFRALSDELKDFLKGIDLSGALRKALAGLKVEVRAELRFVDPATTKPEPTATTPQAASNGMSTGKPSAGAVADTTVDAAGTTPGPSATTPSHRPPGMYSGGSSTTSARSSSETESGGLAEAESKRDHELGRGAERSAEPIPNRRARPGGRRSVR